MEKDLGRQIKVQTDKIILMFKHFIFDIDGTLIDTESTGVNSLIDTVRELMGRDMSYEESYSYFGCPSAKVGGLLGYDGPEDFGAVWERNFIRLSHLIRPFPGVDRVLQNVKAAGRGTGCVTSRNRFEFNKDVHLAKLLPYIDHSVCMEDTLKHKPEPEPVLKYFSKVREATGVSVDPASCIYIGDTLSDSLCARSAGCRFALADWRKRSKDKIPADFVLTDTAEILDLLEI